MAFGMHLQPSFSGLSLTAVGGEEAGRTERWGGQGWEGASLWKFEEDLPSAPGERIGLSWEGLGSPKIYVYF